MIYVVRHGQTEWNVLGKITGRTDIQLNDVGRQQAKDIAKQLENVNLDFVFASPLSRTVETAKIIAGKDVKTDERIIERNNGEFEGKTNKEIAEQLKTFDFNSPNENRYGVENVEVLQERINCFMNEIMQNYKGKNVLIVTHAGVVMRIREYFEGKPKNGDYNAYLVKNCQILEYPN